jgi:hypothetical protein
VFVVRGRNPNYDIMTQFLNWLKMKNQENARKHVIDETPLALRLTTILVNRDSDPDPPQRSPTHQTGRVGAV